MIKRKANVTWSGTGKDGKGQISTESGAIKQVPFTFKTRFQGEKGTNPEELIAAAHAGCFSMALAFMLSGEGHTPESIETSAAVSMEEKPEGWTVTESLLTLKASVPGLDAKAIKEFAEKAKAGCPISRLLNAKVGLEIV